MCSDFAIRATGLGKTYALYDRPADRLLQALWRGRRHYGRRFAALADVSFTLPRGAVLGIVGRNGAGKSTLLQLICGTLTPTAGSIEVRGRVAALLELGAGFNPDFTGRENVFMNAAILGLPEDEIRQRYDDIVEFAGIGDFIEQPVRTYSSGMYVRLAFAVATCVDPDILIIDEALSVGDGAFARKSFDRIMELKAKGATILFCSHSMYHIEAICDQALWLEQGRTKLFGVPQDVVSGYSRYLAQDQATAVATEPEMVAEPAVTQPAPMSTEGYARFTRIEVSLDGKPGHQLRLRPGENTLTVDLQFDSDPSLPAPVLGVTLDYGQLLAVTCAVSRTDGVAIERDALGRGKAILTFPQLALRKGEYRVGVYLGCENALHMYESALIVATLTVEDPLIEPGLVHLPHVWRTAPGHSKTEESLAPKADALWHCAELADGRTLWVDTEDSLGLIANRVFEADESALCASLLRPGDRVLDVGANLGYYTTLCAELVGPAGRVDAVEPDPNNFALLNANTSVLQAQGRVRLHQLALSDQPGVARLFRSKDNVGMHRLYESVCCDASNIEVPARLGDELALAPLDLIKIDIEGFEPYALRGLATTLAQSPRLKILCEYSPLSMLEAGADPGPWLAWMQAQGFCILGFDGSGWSEAACANLKEQTNRLARIDMSSLTAGLRQADSATVAAAAAAAAAALGYTRPIVENLLFVRPGQHLDLHGR